VFWYIRKGRCLRQIEGKASEGENSLKPQARISLNYRAKAYLALLPSFDEHHASVLEKYRILEISLLSRKVCLDPVDRLTRYMVHFCLFVL
jgi:hypothetical protein